jgi:hypothetical protein
MSEEYSKEKGYASIHEILAMNGINQRKLVEEIENEEKNDRESVDDVKAEIEANKEKTRIAKLRFIGEIKEGLGEEIRKNPNTVTFIKKPWYVKFGHFFKRLFTKF